MNATITVPRIDSSSPVATLAANGLLAAFADFVEMLLVAEVDQLCGAPRCSRADTRVNYRCGTHKRTIRTHLGPVVIRVPHLRYYCSHPSLPKRLQRLETRILSAISRIISGAPAAAETEAAALVRELWMLELTDALHVELTKQTLFVLSLHGDCVVRMPERSAHIRVPFTYSVY